MGSSLGDDAITLDGSVDDLASNVLVGEADNEAVLGRVVLVLVLNGQTAASLVVRLAFTTTTELDLVALKVSLVLHDLDESHF